MKKLLMLFTLALALMLSACTQTTKPTPTGDVEKDLKALKEYIQAKPGNSEMEAVVDVFTKFYGSKDEADKMAFGLGLLTILADSVGAELGDAASETTEEMKEAAENAADEVGDAVEKDDDDVKEALE